MQFGAQEIPSASRWLRLANVLIDYVCLYLFSFCFGLFIYFVFGEAAIKAVAQVPDVVLGIPILLTYYVLFEFVSGKTPGKWVTRTQVIADKGAKPTLQQILWRTVSRFIPFEALSFFRAGGLGWHDTISDTRVVRSRDLVVSEPPQLGVVGP